MARNRLFFEDWMTRGWWIGVSGLAASVGAIVTTVQFILDRRSMWFVVLAAAFLLLAAAALAVSARRGAEQRLVVIDDYRRDAPEYYRQYAAVLRRVRHEIYHAGGGFHGRDEQSREYGAVINQATRKALDSGARLYRIQTSDQAGRDWAHGLATMISDYPGRALIYQDLGRPVFADVGVYDPDERSCVVHLAIKAESTYGLGRDARVVGAVFIFGNRDLARGLQRLFAKRLAVLGEPMTAEAVTALGATQGSK